MGRPEMQKTDGHWALSGPGWAAEWNMAGRAVFCRSHWSRRRSSGRDENVEIRRQALINCGYATAIGESGRNGFRYRSNKRQGALDRLVRRAADVDEDNEMKLYWAAVFVLGPPQCAAGQGPANITLARPPKSPVAQVDVLVLTTDAGYQPRIKDRPPRYAWDLLDAYRGDSLRIWKVWRAIRARRNCHRPGNCARFETRASCTCERQPHQTGGIVAGRQAGSSARAVNNMIDAETRTSSRSCTPAAATCRSSPIRESCLRSTAWAPNLCHGSEDGRECWTQASGSRGGWMRTPTAAGPR